MERIVNFGDLAEEYSNLNKAKVVVLPVPYDGTSTWLKGADKGPAAIIEASTNMELYDIETDSEVYKNGIFTSEPINENSSPEQMVSAVKVAVSKHISNGKFVVTIGGEHSVSIGAIEAAAQVFGDLTVLQLDAHSDLRPEYNNSKYNHACVMSNIKKLVPVVQVGIRSMDIVEKKFLDTDKVFFAKDIHSSSDWVEDAVTKLSENVYITIDLDVFDPSIMPSTGTPEPGGLLWYDVLGLMRTVFEKRNVVGFDVVELCPDKRNKAPDFLAAKLIYKLLSYKLGSHFAI